ARGQLPARHRASTPDGLCTGRDLSHRESGDAGEPHSVLDERGDLGWRRHLHVRGALVGAPPIMTRRIRNVTLLVATVIAIPTTTLASGHGPVFGAATPTLGRGGWSVDQAWTLRAGDDDQRQQMLKTMLSFGVTENLQVSGSFPLAMSDGG